MWQPKINVISETAKDPHNQDFFGEIDLEKALIQYEKWCEKHENDPQNNLKRLQIA